MKNFNILILTSISLFIILLFSSCEEQADKEDKIINNYLDENNLTAEKHNSGLYYIIEKEGSSDHPTLEDNVEVKYKGYLTDGTVFDQASSSVNFPLDILIEGWQIGIPMLGRGGKGIFFIPSALGYGNSKVGSIPANSVLIFEIELVDFN